jgi:hypothetical protein
MKEKLLFVIAALLIGMMFVRVGQAITVNPASSVTADSAATALTIPYRDASANFAVNILTGGVSYTNKTIAQLQGFGSRRQGRNVLLL